MEISAVNGASLPQWQHQEATNRFSAVVKAAASGAAQMVTVQGVPAAVVLSPQAYERLLAKGQHEILPQTPGMPVQSLSQALCCLELDDAESVLFSRNRVANSSRGLDL